MLLLAPTLIYRIILLISTCIILCLLVSLKLPILLLSCPDEEEITNEADIERRQAYERAARIKDYEGKSKLLLFFYLKYVLFKLI